MAWLKAWDACVFKSSASAASKKAAAKKRSHAAAAASANPTPGFGTHIDPADPLGRPQEKILMLCGPPGLGKTTMAHVLASQAGYSILEINASDDRSAKIVTERVASAISTRTLDSGKGRKGGLGGMDGGGMALGENRPTCVIIDEVDGAGGGGAGEGGFIRALVKLVMDGSVVKKTGWGGGGKGASLASLQLASSSF